MYQHILTPTDGSERSEQAVELAFSLADQFDATVHALSVAEMVQQKDQLRTDAEDEAEQALAHVEDRAQREDVEGTFEIREGMPGEEIVHYADESDVDAIVMGTQGKTGLDKMLLGSVTEKVLENSSVPVITVQPAEY